MFTALGQNQKRNLLTETETSMVVRWGCASAYCCCCTVVSGWVSGWVSALALSSWCCVCCAIIHPCSAQPEPTSSQFPAAGRQPPSTYIHTDSSKPCRRQLCIYVCLAGPCFDAVVVGRRCYTTRRELELLFFFNSPHAHVKLGLEAIGDQHDREGGGGRKKKKKTWHMCR
jgi:hypothetical protein